MKKKTVKIFTVAILLITVFTVCNKEPVQGVSLDKNVLIVGVGETVKLTPIIVPYNAHNIKVNWESSDTDVATVDNNGNVTGKSGGQTVIKVFSDDNGKTAQCAVTVLQPIEPEEMIWVEGGTFMMGPNDGGYWFYDELPRHEVTLSGFYISKYMVTQKEWISVMRCESTWDNEGKGDDKPAWMTSWDDVQEYISRLNALTGKNYRLPTEAEWEYAARGGNKSHDYEFSGSNNIDEVAWYKGNTLEFNPLHPVGQKKPNELGIYDMSGNMCEWCSDYWGKYPNVPLTNPTGPNIGVYRIIRGGAFYSESLYCRNAYRGKMGPNLKICGGFRLVQDKI